MQLNPLTLFRKRLGMTLAALVAMLVAGFLIYGFLARPSPVVAHKDKAGAAQAPVAVQQHKSKPAVVRESPARKKASQVASLPGHTPRNWPGKPFARSLDGTQIDGELRADANGNLIVDLKVKDFFDYFLSTVGEVKPETAVAEMEKLARASLPPKALNQAMTLLGDYLNYKEKAMNFAQQKLSVPPGEQGAAYQISVLKQGLTKLRQLRRETMPPDAVKAFFGNQEAYGNYVLKSLEIQQRTDLTASEKAQMITNARNQLPAIIRHAQNQLVQNKAQMQQIQKVEDTASSPDDAAQKLEQMGVSQGQVDQIVAYMNRKANFDSQYKAYSQDLKRLETASLAPGDMQQAKEQLLKQYFDNSEEQTWARLRDMEQKSSSQTSNSSSGKKASL